MVLHRSGGVLAPSSLPELTLETWQPTKDTLQLYTQVVGKIRLLLAPPEPQWAHVTFYVTSRGLTTGPMPYRDRALQIDFDFILHTLIITTSDGGRQSLDLGPRTVADFYNDVFALLEELKIVIDINPIPQEVPTPISFEKDTIHASYDRDFVGRFWQILVFSDSVLKKHRAPFQGRHTPVHFFWGGFDLAYTRYSGRPATPPPDSPWLMRTSMDAEEIYAGFWLGDARFPEPAFGAYIYPKPEGLESFASRPAAASWNEKIGLFLLRYDDVRTSSSPADMLLEYFSSTYQACAFCARWDDSMEGK
jgi:hypothetical protein